MALLVAFGFLVLPLGALDARASGNELCPDILGPADCIDIRGGEVGVCEYAPDAYEDGPLKYEGTRRECVAVVYIFGEYVFEACASETRGEYEDQYGHKASFRDGTCAGPYGLCQRHDARWTNTQTHEEEWQDVRSCNLYIDGTSRVCLDYHTWHGWPKEKPEEHGGPCVGAA